MKNSSCFEPLLARPGILDELDAEIASRSLGEFVLQAWPIVEPSTPFVSGWHIDAISEHLEAISRGQLRNLLINVPPRHMKSLLVSVLWPAWEWINWPERRWLFSSYGAQLSIRDSIKCRRLVESPWYRQRWADRFALTSDQNTKGRFDNILLSYPVIRLFVPDGRKWSVTSTVAEYAGGNPIALRHNWSVSLFWRRSKKSEKIRRAS